MAKPINIASNTDITAMMLEMKSGKSKVRLLAKGTTGTFFIKHNDTQGYASGGETLSDGIAREFDMDMDDIFKVVYTGGTVTAKKIG